MTWQEVVRNKDLYCGTGVLIKSGGELYRARLKEIKIRGNYVYFKITRIFKQNKKTKEWVKSDLHPIFTSISNEPLQFSNGPIGFAFEVSGSCAIMPPIRP